MRLQNSNLVFSDFLIGTQTVMGNFRLDVNDDSIDKSAAVSGIFYLAQLRLLIHVPRYCLHLCRQFLLSAWGPFKRSYLEAILGGSVASVA